MVENCSSLSRKICFNALIIIVVIAFLGGCGRVTNQLQIAPAISGTVTREGRPVAGAVIELLADPGNRTETTRTNASGRFQLAKIVEVQPAMLLLGDRTSFQHRLVISQGGKRYLGLKVFSASGLPFKTMNLRCELTNPVSKLGPTIEGLCTIRRGS